MSSGAQTTSTGVAWSDNTSGVSSGAQTTSTGVAWSDQAGQTGGVAEMLAAASDRVVERCGLSYDDSAGMYYDSNLGLYYDPVRWRGKEGRGLHVSSVATPTDNRLATVTA